VSIFRIAIKLIELVINPNGHKRHFVPNENAEKYIIVLDDKLEIAYLQLLRGATKNDLYISIEETGDTCTEECFRRIIIDFRGGDQFCGSIDEIVNYLKGILRIPFLRIAVILPNEYIGAETDLKAGREIMNSKSYVKAFHASSDAKYWLLINA
jgi:hypothetical protein